MLQKPDVHTDRILKLADHIEKLSDSDFGMRNWCTCIAGHAVKQSGEEKNLFNLDVRFVAANLLGLSTLEATQLFCPKRHGLQRRQEVVSRRAQYVFGAPNPIRDDITPKQAAKCLRHLAVTGEVDWEKACA